MSIIVFDTETTGLLGPMAMGVELQPYCVELHAIKLDYGLHVIDTLSFRCKPGAPMSDGATRVNGITDAMLANEKSFAYHFIPLAQFFTGAELLVGHNIMFDKIILYWELVRLGATLAFPWPYRSICTIETIQKITGHRMNLTDLHMKLFGQGFVGAHTASADCEITMKCFVKLVEQGDIVL